MEKHTMTLKINKNDISIEYGDSVINGVIVDDNNGFFFSGKDGRNDILFEVAGTEDKSEFQKKILGYKDEKGRFPYCRSADDVIKLLKVLVSVYNKMHVCSKHKHIKFNFKL